ncbi:MAG: hypothetical protein CMJ47_06345 [Planctomyces sp.]|nr:hypothetical protein [Planctomyces sp.]
MPTYRTKICKPDKRGYYRPEVGGKRFTVGHKTDISEGEAQRRRDALALLYDRQRQIHGLEKWANWVLPYASKLAKGEQIVFEVSDRARMDSGQASEEALMLERLREVGLAIAPTDPETIAQGERQLREWIDQRVRAAVSQTIAQTSEHMGLSGVLAERITGTLPNPTESETRTFHEAMSAYRKHVEKNGKRLDDGKLAPSPNNYIDWSRLLENAEADFAMWELDKPKLEEIVSKWKNRPVSASTGERISHPHAKHMLDVLWAALTFVDESPNWKWSFPPGTRRIKRTPIRLDSDRKKSRARRIAGTTYNPEQLAIIARQLKPLGKLVLGLGVNCAMQPAEFGRVEIEDFYDVHPETGEKANWIIFDRPKTHEYGEWLLWDEVATLVRWGIKRAKSLNSERLVVQNNGKHWYRDGTGNPAGRIGNWWQGRPCPGDPTHIGIVTKLERDVEGFPRYTIKTLRKILPHLIRPKYGKEVADLVNARHVDNDGRIAGSDTDRYADRLYDKVAEAIREMESHFRPFLDALGEGLDELDSDVMDDLVIEED